MTWLLISRVAALLIVFSLLVSFIVAEAVGRTLDGTVVVAFLGVASGLLFGPAAGYYIAVRKSNGSSQD